MYYVLICTIYVQDTIVYLTAGNMYYCHTDTSLRYAAIYNVTVDKDLLRAQTISRVHGIFDASCIVIMFGLEIFINLDNCVRFGKYKQLTDRFSKVLKIHRVNTVQDNGTYIRW